MISGDASEFYDLAAQLASASGRVGAPISAALRRTALAIEADAKALAPEGPTGDLRDGISATFQGDGRTSVMSAEIIADAPYAGYVEDGTSEMAPQPFMQPAADRNTPIFEAAFEQIPGELL